MIEREQCYCPKCLNSCSKMEENPICQYCDVKMIIIPGAKHYFDSKDFVEKPERKNDPRFSQEAYEQRQIPNTYQYPNDPFSCPKCISCGSSNIRKISVASKVGSVALWGIFAAGRTSKRYHCNNCGTEW